MSLPIEVPDYVSRALRTSLRFGYLEATRNSAGRLLASVAALSMGPIGEFITGSGAGAAWLASGAPRGVEVITLETDPVVAARAVETLAGSGIEVIQGGWRDLAQRGPFGVLHLARLEADLVDVDQAYETVKPKGVVVIDEFAPTLDGVEPSWTAVDQVRQRWLTDPRFVSVGLTMGDSDVIMAVRAL